MTQRERHASGGVSEAAPRPVAGIVTPQRLAPPLETGTNRTLLWEDYFQSATPTQQLELLSLADRQGLLYSHQLPALGNGAAEDRQRQWYVRLLAGHTGELTPISPIAVPAVDADLDPIQREAVNKALATSDLCLIQGLPGTGKSRVAAEIVTLAAARGERVLLLAPTTAAIDRVLEWAGPRDVVCPIRCLGREERPESLAPRIASWTLPERVRVLREEALAGAQREIDAADARCRRRRQDEGSWPRLRELADAWQQLEVQVQGITERCHQIPGEVEQEAAGAEAASEAKATDRFPAAVQTFQRRRQYVRECHEKALADLSSQAEQRRQQLSELNTQLTALRPLADAKQQKRWWTAAWWRATVLENSTDRLLELEGRHEQAQTGLAKVEEETQRLTQEKEQSESEAREERRRLIDNEIASRQSELDEQTTVLRREQALLQDQWQTLLQEMDAGGPRPAALNPEAVAEALDNWGRQREREDKFAVFAREWLAQLQQAADSLPRRLADLANLVAATPAALGGDEYFGDASSRANQFDLLVLEEAHFLTETEFLNAARRARRCVLIGEPTRDCEGAEQHTRENASSEARSRSGPASQLRVPSLRPAAARPGFFQRLWRNLHCDPSQWPYAWVLENDRLCCRLRPIPADQRQWVESERVADFPEIELRILALPRSQPALAEVLFPPSMSIVQAKEYIFKELEELPVQASGHSLRWTETADRIHLRLTDQPVANTTPVVLGCGVRELVSGAPASTNGAGPAPRPWQTCSLEFDRAEGWHRQRADEWVQTYLGTCDLGRTVLLDTPHRMQPDLARFLSDWLFDGSYVIVPDPSPGPASAKRHPSVNGCPSPVEFVAVPPSRPEPDGRRKGETPASGRGDQRRPGGNKEGNRPNRGGAGLELDLSDPRHRERLPSEDRPGLPERGFVNHQEAQEVVRFLQALQAEQGKRLKENGREIERLTVGIVALYAAQAELIRCLLRRAPGLADSLLDVHVGVPAALREREFQVLLVSLTRSHTHRAVTFGDGPHGLTQGLTRARSKLVLFGDPGTLVRRSQWEGPLDHLDETASARERELITRLVRYLQGQGVHPRTFHLREGTRA